MRHWPPTRVAAVAVLWLLGVVLLAVLSVLAHRVPTFPGDLGLEEWVQGLDTLHAPWLVHMINLASDANWPTPAGVIAIAVIALLLLAGRIRAGLGTILAGFGADAINVTLNGLVARPRPNNIHIRAVAHLGLHSFPSGHVTHVTAFYGFLLYLSVGEERAHPHRRAWRLFLRAVQAICLYFLIFIRPSRVLEGEHWPSDVFASYLLGGLVLALAVALYHGLGIAWQRHQDNKRRAVPAA
jgi:undecaprenyl-diphosphatase